MSSDDKLTIETPEQTSLDFTLAGIGSRGLAVAIDLLLQGAVVAVIAVIGALIVFAGFTFPMGRQWAIAILIILFFVMRFGYFAIFETIWNGRTPGKRWTHLRVIMDSGRPVSTQAVILRNLIRIVDELPTLYAVGIITSLISAQNKRVGDYLAGTVVIREKSVQGGRSLWDAPPTNLLAASPLRTLAAGELQLVEAFLERRSSLQEEVRRSMARQIADRLTKGWSLPQESVQDPEKFLEALAEQSRNVAHFR